MKVSVKKLEFLGVPDSDNDDPTVISFESLPVCVKQTDGQTYTPLIPKSRSSINERNHQTVGVNDCLITTCKPYGGLMLTVSASRCRKKFYSRCDAVI